MADYMALTQEENDYIIKKVINTPYLFNTILQDMIADMPDNKHIVKYAIKHFANRNLFKNVVTAHTQQDLLDYCDIFYTQEMTKHSINNMANMLMHNKRFVTDAMLDRLLDAPGYEDFSMSTIESCMAHFHRNYIVELGLEKYSDEELAEMLKVNLSERFDVQGVISMPSIKHALIAYEIETVIQYRLS